MRTAETMMGRTPNDNDAVADVDLFKAPPLPIPLHEAGSMTRDCANTPRLSPSSTTNSPRG